MSVMQRQRKFAAGDESVHSKRQGRSAKDGYRVQTRTHAPGHQQSIGSDRYRAGYLPKEHDDAHVDFIMIARQVRLVAVASSTSAICLLAAAQEPSSWDFAAWSMTCDNTNHCEAAAVRSDDDESSGPDASLRISRDAGPGAPVVGRIFVQARGSVRLRVQGKLFAASSVDGAPENADIPNSVFVHLLPALIRAKTAEVVTSSGTYELPLSGLKATLLKMDDVQGRIGTGGALIQGGSHSERGVPSAPAPSVIETVRMAAPLPSDSELVDVLTRRLAPACDADASPRELREGTVHRVSSTKVLFLFACSEASANQSFSIWLVDDQAPYTAKLLQFFRPGDVDVNSLFNAEFDGQLLKSTVYGSTTHQCWIETSWAWTGAAFARVKEEGAACPDAAGVSFRLWTASILPRG